MTIISIYSDPDLLDRGRNTHWLLRPLFAPDLRESREDDSNDYSVRPFRKIVAPYNRVAHSLFRLSSLEDCDLAVVPVDWQHVRGSGSTIAKPDRALIARIQRFADEARQAGKPVLMFFSSSKSHEAIPVPGAYVFRSSMYRSRSTDRDLAMPIVIMRDIQGEFPDCDFGPVRKADKPKVGFCGFSRSVTYAERAKDLAFKVYGLVTAGRLEVSPYRGLELRNRCLSLLRDSPLIDGDFIAQEKSVYLTSDQRAMASRERLRRPFVENILASPYHLSLRGSANYSFRQWEILCCGRIPLFLDTDCGMPAEGFVDWSKSMVLIGETDIERIAEALADFHHDNSGEEILEKQTAARRIWEDWGTPQGLAAQLHRYVARMKVG